MKLADKLGTAHAGTSLSNKFTPAGRLDVKTYHRVKSMVHSRLVDLLDLSAIDEIPKDSLKGWIKDVPMLP